MLQKLYKRHNEQQGFTIIEVLIVLAIAGLILLIVFLAVPALQRNARNTTRKNDVAGLLGGISEFVNNNGGQLPSTITICSASTPVQTSCTWTFTIGPTTATNLGTPVNSGYYNTLNSVVLTPCAAAPCTAAAPTTGVVTIYTNAVCPSATGAPTDAGASGRNIAAYFAVEPNSTAQCTQS